MFWIELGARFAVFAVVLGLCARRRDDVAIRPGWMLLPVAGLFAGLNAAMYWLLSSALSIASLFTLSLVAPILANAALLWGTTRLLRGRYLIIEGLWAMFVLVSWITFSHGLLWFIFNIVL